MLKSHFAISTVCISSVENFSGYTHLDMVKGYHLDMVKDYLLDMVKGDHMNMFLCNEWTCIRYPCLQVSKVCVCMCVRARILNK